MPSAVTLPFLWLRWRQRVLGSLFHGLAKLGDLAADLRAAREDVDVLLDVPYGPHPVAHRLDIYRPRDADGPLPVLLYIHGGAFVLCSKDTHRHLALLNAQRAGYLVFNINYRLAPQHPFPAAIADACAAYRWVAAHAREYGGDPDRIVVAGESAGGNLALGVAIAATYRRPETYTRAVFHGPRPLGVMPLMPLLQTSDPASRAGQRGINRLALSVLRDIERAYLGGPCAMARAPLLADPVRVLEECGRPDREFPHVFSGAGTADLCCADVRRLAHACRELGLPVQTAYFRDEGHAFHALHWRDAARRFWRKSVAFLRRVAGTPARAAPLARRLAVMPASTGVRGF
jgi:acetyl esterase